MNGEDIFFGDLITKDNKISYVGPSIDHNDTFDRVIECDGNVLLPGLKNAHTHSAMTFLRSYADDLALQDWLFGVCIPMEEGLTPEYVKELSKLAYLEYLTSGITASFEMYFYPKAIKEAAEEIGMRAKLVGMLTSYQGKKELEEYYETWNSEESLVTIGFGIHSEYTSGEADFNLAYELCHKYHAPCYAHMSETKGEVDRCVESRGVTPMEYCVNRGLFDYGGAIYHGNFLTDEEIKLLNEKNVSVVTNPGSNTKLASGVCDITKLQDNNINIAIGTDGPASNNCLDMFKEMTLVSSLTKVTTLNPQAAKAEDILYMATVGGAKAMGLTNCDTLEVNKLADIVMIDMSRPNMRPIHNVVKNIVYSGSKENVKLTMINGKILYEDGKFFVNEDVNDIYDRCQQISEELIKIWKEKKLI